MKNVKRILLTVVAAILLVVMSVAGTLAYLTSTSENVVNTFTVGNVAIKLDEAKVTGDGTKLESDENNRVLANSYKLQPGLTYLKDPTVTVAADSEDCYVRILVTITDYKALKAAFPAERYADWWQGDMFLLQNLVEGWDGNVWECVDFNDGTYEFRYTKIVDTATETDNNAVIGDIQLPDLFTAIKMPGDMTNTEVGYLANLKINLIAHAIQSEGFADDDAAWTAWTTATK